MNKILLLYHTIYFLKLKQIYFRLFYALRTKWRKYRNYQYKISIQSDSNTLHLRRSIAPKILYKEGKFNFLNLEHVFSKGIDWNYGEYGKLWTYNLNYFEYLIQNDISKEEGERLIYDFIDKSLDIHDGRMPFPISLRGINWIKFLTKYAIKDQKIDDSLFAQYIILMDNIEYHILGNHLLENGFSLLYGAYYFKNDNFYKKAKAILEKELDEQVLEDGAHFELSPMYHQIMLLRILDSINLLQNNRWKNDTLLNKLKEKSEMMLGWLLSMTYRNGAIPLLNDSSYGIAPTTAELIEYAKKLHREPKSIVLNQSGYRKIENEAYECVIDIGNIGPDYIPGHAHSDTFSFELYVQEKPVIVDTGLSTYETNDRRMSERATSAHNTVEVNEEDQSRVWGGFRVAQRAKVIDINESDSSIAATHNGYKKSMGILHKREWEFASDMIIIRDSINGENTDKLISYLHFHPDIPVTIENDTIITPLIKISYYNIIELSLLEYEYAPEFNRRKVAQMIKAVIKQNSSMEIKIL